MIVTFTGFKKLSQGPGQGPQASDWSTGYSPGLWLVEPGQQWSGRSVEWRVVSHMRVWVLWYVETHMLRRQRHQSADNISDNNSEMDQWRATVPLFHILFTLYFISYLLNVRLSKLCIYVIVLDTQEIFLIKRVEQGYLCHIYYNLQQMIAHIIAHFLQLIIFRPS